MSLGSKSNKWSTDWWVAFVFAISVSMFQLVDSVSANSAFRATQDSSAGESPDKDQDKQLGSQKPRAWEYWAYNVRIWVVTDQSTQVNAMVPDLRREIESKAVLVDSSSWKVNTQMAPPVWNWRMASLLDDPTSLRYRTEKQIEQEFAAREAKETSAKQSAEKDGTTYVPNPVPPVTKLSIEFSQQVEQLESEDVDKLIVVRVDFDTAFRVTAREYDLRTRTWGAKTEITCAHPARLGLTAYRAMANSFMPLTRIEKAFDKRNEETRRNERWARVRVRALGLSKDVEINDEGVRTVVPNASSPVWVRDTDILKPTVRRINLEKIFESVTVIDWTFLVIRDKTGTLLECKTISKDAVPLSGRTGSRIEKLALVIRPPNRPTVLTLVAKKRAGVDRDLAAGDPLSDYEVFSRYPDMPIDQKSEMVGKTDFFGKIEIPPSDDGIRVLFIKSGYAGLARLPLIPGLYDETTVELRNDAARLHAEGVVRGLRNQITDLLAQRKLLENQINRKLEENDVDGAVKLLNEFEELEDGESLKVRINTERDIMLTAGKESSSRINGMFNSLVGTVQKFMPRSQADNLRKKVQEARSRAGL